MTQTPSARQDYAQRWRENTRLWREMPLFIAALEGVKTPEQILLEREQAERLDRLIDQLKPPRLGLAVRYYYGIRCEPNTLEQVAQKFGVTRERVRQILHKATGILRYWILKQENPKWLREIEARERAQKKARDAANNAAAAARAAERMLREAAELEVDREQRLAQLNEQFRRRAQRDYDYCYVEAHRLNVLWELELERRADEMRHNLNMAERRLHCEPKAERDWLLVGSTIQARRKLP